MHKQVRFMVQGALIAAMYAALTHLQNLLLPNSATMAIQFRASEALCVLAFFTPAAVPGLTVGCFLFNLTTAVALPLDPVVGPVATFLAVQGMYLTRKFTFKGIPILQLALPALTNAFLVGWELTLYIGGGFWLNALYVALGELAVLYTLGILLCTTMKRRRISIS